MKTRGRALVAAALAMLLAGCGDSGGAKSANSAAAESAVRGFFTALTAGDAKTALTFLEKRADFDPATDPLLTAAALGPAARPSGVQYAAPRVESGLTFVDVTYQAGGASVQQAIALTANGGGFLLRDALVQLTVTGVQGRPVAVNGVKMGNADLNIAVFPGTYQVAAGGNTLLEGATVTAAPAVAGGGQTAAANFAAAKLTKTAAGSIPGKVRQALDACAAATRPKTPGCPFWLDARSGKVQWSIKTYPAMQPQVTNISGGPPVSLVSDKTGKAHWSATYVDKTGKQRFGSGDILFAITGSATATASGIKVSLTA